LGSRNRKIYEESPVASISIGVISKYASCTFTGDYFSIIKAAFRNQCGSQKFLELLYSREKFGVDLTFVSPVDVFYHFFIICGWRKGKGVEARKETQNALSYALIVIHA